MLKDLILRFVLGGTISSLFSVVGRVVKPKTLSGIFGAAPLRHDDWRHRIARLRSRWLPVSRRLVRFDR